jgi:hypothetical protein
LKCRWELHCSCGWHVARFGLPCPCGLTPSKQDGLGFSPCFALCDWEEKPFLAKRCTYNWSTRFHIISSSRLSVGNQVEKNIVSQPQPHAPNYLLRDIAPAGIEVVWGSETELGGPNIETTLCLGAFPAKTSPHTLPCLKRIGSSCDKGLAWIIYAELDLIGLYFIVTLIYTHCRVLALLGWVLCIAQPHFDWG